MNSIGVAKKNKKKLCKTASEEAYEMRRQGVKQRAETWSRFKNESRQGVKSRLRLEY